jgi:hypothetical protein
VSKSLYEQLFFSNTPAPAGAKADPFGNAVTNPFNPVVTSCPDEADARKSAYDNPVPVIFPRYLAAPEGAETVDIRRIAVLNPGESIKLFDFTCLPGSTAIFYNYALFTDALNNADVLWNPAVDGRRILAYHGDPADNYKINLSVGVDMSQAALIPCQVIMQPGQVLSWQITNFSAVQVSMGVRMVGYLDVGQRLTSSKIGG